MNNKFINIIAEGSAEENFVNTVIVKHFAALGKYVSVRKIKTGWDSKNNKPAKGGFGPVPNFAKCKSDILNWIQSDRGKPNTWYTTFVDFYAFPVDSSSPLTKDIQQITDAYKKIEALENNFSVIISNPNFIPYVQLHEFETFLLVEPDKLAIMYPNCEAKIRALKKDIANISPELINHSLHAAPSKRVIKFLPEYKGQKSQVGPLVAEEIGLSKLRTNCPHFDSWITKLETL
jgi:Domain of unknown function (DUF4276)